MKRATGFQFFELSCFFVAFQIFTSNMISRWKTFKMKSKIKNLRISSFLTGYKTHIGKNSKIWLIAKCTFLEIYWNTQNTEWFAV
jgi:hypothetical protein